MAVLTELVDPDPVSVLEEPDILGVDLTEDADAESWTGERVTSQQLRIQPHLAAYAAHLILEEHAQWLDDLEFHVVREPTDIVVAFYGGAGTARGGDALDDIRVDGTLSEPLDPLEESTLVVEDIDESGPDGLALAFRVGDTGQGGVELVGGADALDVQPHALVTLEHLLEFVLAEQAIVDEYAMEPIADGPM